MEILATIDNDMKEALKSHDSEQLSVLRLLKTAIKNAQIAKGSELSEVEIINVLEKQAKQRKDSIEQYRAGNREDLATKEENELPVVQRYLPQKLSPEETEALVEDVIRETGAESISAMGQVIKETMNKAGGKVEGSIVSAIAKEKLS
jgi:uncharacterized protein YqeY